MANRSRNRSFGRRRTPNRSWSGFSVVEQAVSSSSKLLLATFALNNPGIDETVLRNVGLISISTDQSAASEFQHGALGIIIVTDTAAALGVAAIPSPIADSDDDGWLLHVPFSQFFDLGSNIGFNTTSVQYSFDSKAKRIVHDGSSLALVIENASATDGFFLGMVLRTLTMVTGSG